MLRFLREFRGIPRERRWLVFEAMITLSFARVVLRVVPFAWLVRLFERQPHVCRSIDSQFADTLRWSVWRACRYLSGEIVCFPRAIAAHCMLRRRGISSRLYYGAALKPDRTVDTHVWLRSGDHDVIGHKSAVGHRVLASWPAENKTAVAQAITTGGHTNYE